MERALKVTSPSRVVLAVIGIATDTMKEIMDDEANNRICELNITQADRDNQEAVIDALLDSETEISGLLYRAVPQPDDHPFDYHVDCFMPESKEWMRHAIVEIKCRSKRYETLLISQYKLRDLLNWAKQWGMFFYLLVWFKGERVVRVLEIENLNFNVSTVANEKRGESSDAAYEIPLWRFSSFPIDAVFQHSKNSDQI